MSIVLPFTDNLVSGEILDHVPSGVLTEIVTSMCFKKGYTLNVYDCPLLLNTNNNKYEELPKWICIAWKWKRWTKHLDRLSSELQAAEASWMTGLLSMFMYGDRPCCTNKYYSFASVRREGWDWYGMMIYYEGISLIRKWKLDKQLKQSNS